MFDRHEVPTWMVDSLAAGRCGGEVLTLLFAGQRSRRMLQLIQVMRALSDAERPVQPAVSQAITLIEQMDARAPAALRELLAHPQTGMLLGAAFARAQGGFDPGQAGYLARELAAIAVSVALRSDLDVTACLNVSRGWVELPGLGSLRCPGGGSAVDVLVRTGPPLQLAAVGRRSAQADAAPDWRAPTVLTASAHGLAGTVWLDHHWPHRTILDPKPSVRLPEASLERWREQFAQAWELVVDHSRPMAESMAGGMLQSIVPLAGGRRGGRSATSRDAVASLGCSASREPSDLAVTLIHEIAHSQLWALMNLVDLCLAGPGKRRFTSPWRRDPRPATGLVQGAYAFLAVAEFWASVHARTGDPAAAQSVSRTRRQVGEALRTLESADILTDVGHRLVQGLYQRLAVLSP